MTPNPYESPQVDRPANQPRVAVPRTLVRIFIGIFAALFIAPAGYVAILIATQQHALAELLVIPMGLGGLVATALSSYSRVTVLRVATWLCAGLGAGLLLEAILMGGLGVGTFITLSGLVLGPVGAIIGYRQQSVPTSK
jgi:hypothetical protein